MESQIRLESDTVVIERPRGRPMRFHKLWLRDNRRGTRHPKTGQRIRSVLELGERVQMVAVGPRPAPGPAAVVIEWSDGEVSDFDLDWLEAHAPRSAASVPPAEPWRSPPALDAVRLPYNGLDASTEKRLLETLFKHGFAVLEDVGTAEGTVLEIASRLAFVRETNYGRLFDVRTVEGADHLAYTDVPLALHTDNPYRNPVPGIQMLHCIQPAVEGGASILADGFAAAGALRAEDPSAFELLSRVEVPFRYRDSTCDLRARRPLLGVDEAGCLRRIAFNDRSMAPLDLPAEAAGSFYAAYLSLAKRVADERMWSRFVLEAGSLLVFDNERLLHGRGPVGAGLSQRWLQGCYVDRDALESRYRLFFRS